MVDCDSTLSIHESMLVMMCVCIAAGTLLLCFNQVRLSICDARNPKGDPEKHDILEKENLDLHQRVATLEIELEKEKKLHHAVPLEFEQRNRPVHVRPPNLISVQRTVYSTKTGQCWHADIHCQHLRSTVAKAGVLHLAPCSRCVH